MFTKRMICALMCSILLVTAVVPAYAVSGSDTDTHIEYGLGVKVKSKSVLNAIHSKGEIELSFVTGVAHLPSSDYNCRIIFLVYYGSSYGYELVDTLDQQTMSLSRSNPNSYAPVKCNYEYYVNSASVHTAVIE